MMFPHPPLEGGSNDWSEAKSVRRGVTRCAPPRPETLRVSTRPQGAGEKSRHRELHQLDGFEVLHAAANSLRRVEENVRLGAVRIAQDADADAIDHKITAAEIAERD